MGKVVFFFFALLGCTATGTVIKCSDDDGCPKGFYCISSRCFECFDCNLTNRLNNGNCPKTIHDCGHCKNGYEDVSLTDDSQHFRKPCKRQNIPTGESGCQHDYDCSHGQFCHENRICAECMECSAYQRHNGLTCARNINECGSCLPGFFDVAVTDGSRRKPCQSSPSPQQGYFQSQQTEVHINACALSVIASALVVALIMICSFLIYTSRKHQPFQSDVLRVESPPPYQENSVESIVEDTGSQLVCGFYKETSEEECGARVFRLPNYITPRQSVPPVNDGNGDANEEVTDSPMDEETMPCPWRPEREGESDNLPLTFSGRLTVGIEATPSTPTIENSFCHCESETSEEPAPKRMK